MPLQGFYISVCIYDHSFYLLHLVEIEILVHQTLNKRRTINILNIHTSFCLETPNSLTHSYSVTVILLRSMSLKLGIIAFPHQRSKLTRTSFCDIQLKMMLLQP